MSTVFLLFKTFTVKKIFLPVVSAQWGCYGRYPTLDLLVGKPDPSIKDSLCSI